MARAAAHYFASPAAFRAWLAAHHASADALVVGFHKRGTGKPSLTWPESVDAAMCFGWIDGVRHNVDAGRYTIRFTPRRPRSIWSMKNITRMRELIAADEVAPAGITAFAARRDDRSAVYSYEQRRAPKLSPAERKRFRANAAAWAFFSAQPPGYQRLAQFWIVSAKRAATRESRLSTLIADSAAGRRLEGLTRPTAKTRAKRVRSQRR